CAAFDYADGNGAVEGRARLRGTPAGRRSRVGGSDGGGTLDEQLVDRVGGDEPVAPEAVGPYAPRAAPAAENGPARGGEAPLGALRAELLEAHEHGDLRRGLGRELRASNVYYGTFGRLCQFVSCFFFPLPPRWAGRTGDRGKRPRRRAGCER